MKGRSPFMRHVSWTQRITLDLFFDRINFDPKIQIRYVDTKNQLTDILTKESFSEEEWNNLFRLKNIMTVCTFPRSHFSHFVSDFFKNSRSTSKRGQEQHFAVTKSKSMSSIPAKTRPIILMSEASTVRVIGVQEVTPKKSWANLKSPGRVMRMPTGVNQSLRQGTATELVTTDNVRHSITDSEIDEYDRRQNEILKYGDYTHQLYLKRTRIICDRGLQDQDPYILRWRQQSILDWQMRRIWRSSNTGTSRMLRIRSSSLQTWIWKIIWKYWMRE